MTYHLAINGVSQAPVSEETLHAMIAQGYVSADALSWREGWTDWRPVAQVFPDRFTQVRQTLLSAEPAAVRIPMMQPPQEHAGVRNTNPTEATVPPSLSVHYKIPVNVWVLLGLFAALVALAVSAAVIGNH